ncbi:Phage major capsid protein [Salmonella bongori N268-08]|uniref:Phage major capsid protein n=1 Tax=Salmonella bongori N268-08 TaxID=1197719 RepID=S5N7F3_SALBN|nr:Phage major capsid protein [Salmonella bongori N268-08]
MSTTSPNTELMAGQLIVASHLIGGLPTYFAPFFPDNAMLITSFSNLSIYFQKGSLRRLMREEPEYNRIATYSVDERRLRGGRLRQVRPDRRPEIRAGAGIRQ